MINITNITMKNFLSVGAVTLGLKLNEFGLTLILGANTDANGGLTRNGAGKTTIMQAIAYALYGTPISKIKQDNLINNINQKAMMVTLEFERDGVTYRIERGRKPNVLRFFQGGTELKADEDLSQGENRHTQEMIDKTVGMSGIMFRHIVALNTYTDPFLRMKAADQREVIEELLGVTQISSRAEILKKLVSQTKETIRDAEATIKATTEANARIQIAIDQAQRQFDQWELDHQNTLSRINAEIAAMSGIDFDSEIAKLDAFETYTAQRQETDSKIAYQQRELEHQTRILKTIDDEVSRQWALFNSDNLDAQRKRLESELSRKETEKTRILNRTEEAKAAKAKLVDDLNSPSASTCICCGQDLVGTDHLQTVMASLQKQIDDQDAVILRLEGDWSGIDQEIASIDAEIIALVDSHAKAKEDATAEIGKLELSKAEPQGQIVTIAAAIEELYTQIATLVAPEKSIFTSRDEAYKVRASFDAIVKEKELEEAKINPNGGQIEAMSKTLQAVDRTALDHSIEVQKHQEFLLKLLTSKDSFIRKKIIDQNLAYLNSRVSHYLDKMGLPHEVKFNSDLTVDITYLGRDFDFEQLSRGEMNRVNMATSWSFRDVWESLNDSFNLMFVDEMLDQGTDGQGAEAALGILKSMARDRGKNVFLISHRDELTARIERTLLVRKENGFTSFEENAFG